MSAIDRAANDNDHPPPANRPVRLDPNLIAADVDGGRIAENILFFARLLRASGLAVGPDKILLATEAVIAAGIRDQRTLYWTLHAVFVNRRDPAPPPGLRRRPLSTGHIDRP